MSVYRRGGKWWIDYFDKNRRRVQESSHSSIRRDAEALLTLRKSEVLRGVYKRPVKIAFGQFGERYMPYATAHNVCGLGNKQMLKPLKKFWGSKSPLGKTPPADIEGFKLHR